MSTLGKPIIECENVSFRYRSLDILEDITFTVNEGDYVGIVGSNGSGKTTLLKLLLRILTPTGGVLRLFGKPVDEFRRWNALGYVPQNVFRGDLNFPATVREVVESGHLDRHRNLWRRLRARPCRAAEEALRVAGVSHLMDTRIGELSGGERQRVFIARALVCKPKLLILDEPTTGVDAAAEEQFSTLLRELNQGGMTILLVSHDLEAVAQEVKTVLCLNRRLVCFGSPSHLQSAEVLRGLYGDRRQMLHHGHKH